MPNPSTLAAMEAAAVAGSTGHAARRNLTRLINIISRSGNPDRPFFYLGGPMSGIPKFNFPEFHRVADALRAADYNIISPAELDDPATEKAALASPDGAPGSGTANGETHEDFLARDIIVVSLPTCVGGIFLPGWYTSRGARAESWVLAFLGKQLFEYEERAGRHRLVSFERDERLREMGIAPEVAGRVPVDKPGEVTVAHREASS